MNAGIAAAVGFLLHEVIVVSKAVKKSESTPDKFNARYYFGKFGNWVNIALNALSTIGLMLGFKEVLGVEVWLLAKIPGFVPPPDGYPILTGFAIGLLSAWIVKWALAKIGKQAADVPMDDGN